MHPASVTIFPIIVAGMVPGAADPSGAEDLTQAPISSAADFPALWDTHREMGSSSIIPCAASVSDALIPQRAAIQTAVVNMTSSGAAASGKPPKVPVCPRRPINIKSILAP